MKTISLVQSAERENYCNLIYCPGDLSSSSVNAGWMRFLLVLAQPTLKWAGRRHMARNRAHQWEEMSMGLCWDLPAAGCRGNGCCAWIIRRVLSDLEYHNIGSRIDRKLTFEMFIFMTCTFRFNTFFKMKVLRNLSRLAAHLQILVFRIMVITCTTLKSSIPRLVHRISTNQCTKCPLCFKW